VTRINHFTKPKTYQSRDIGLVCEHGQDVELGVFDVPGFIVMTIELLELIIKDLRTTRHHERDVFEHRVANLCCCWVEQYDMSCHVQQTQSINNC
jgi:hypothetical protein